MGFFHLSEGISVTRKHNIWQALVHEVRLVYHTLDRQYSSESGGHIKRVCTKLDDISKTELPDTGKKPEEKAVCRYLNEAIDAGRSGPCAGLCTALQRAAPFLLWEYGYKSMPQHLQSSYAYTEVLGPHGNISINDLVFGFVLLAPECYYPEHNHPGIEESYICLSGRVTQNNNDILNPGDFLYNPPGKLHTLVADTNAPCLLSYVWNADSKVLRRFTMEFE